MFDVELAGDDADAMAAEDDVLAQGPQGAVRDELLKGARLALDAGVVGVFDVFALAVEDLGDESLAERRKHQQTHRYMTVSHQMKRVDPVVTGSYLRAESQKAALAAAPAGQTLATDAAVLTPAAEPVES